jgi:hypothetical protein
MAAGTGNPATHCRPRRRRSRPGAAAHGLSLPMVVTATAPAGSASIRVTGTVDGTQATTVHSAEYPGIDCAG